MTRNALAVQLAAALLLFAPVLVLGETFTYNDWLNHVWTEQFSRQFVSGDFYPRWLIQSFAGLGAPTFYFYPPAFFLVAGIARAASLSMIPTQYLIPFSAFLISAASGAAMYALLRHFVDRRLAIAGAIAYQAAPYHLVDFYVRGALAECVAYVFIPLVVLGMIRVATTRDRGTALLPLAYAGLAYSHLPTTVLVSSALACYAVFLAITSRSEFADRIRLLLRFAVLLALGTALAAAYVLPALQLLPYMTVDELWAPAYRPETWFVHNFAEWPLQTFNLAASGLGCAMAVPAAYMLATRRRSPEISLEALFWAAVTVVSLPLMLGLVPWYWQIGPVAKVQFPFRLLVVAEFAFVFSCTLFISRRGLDIRRPQWAGAIAILLASAYPLAHTAAASLSVIAARGDTARAHWESDFGDFEGFVPPQVFRTDDRNHSQERDAGDSRYSAFAARRLPEIEREPVVRLDGGAALAHDEGASMTIDVDTRDEGTLVLRRFYFPSWSASDSEGRKLNVEPTADGLVSFRVPGKPARYVLTQDLPPSARTGLAISAFATLGLALFTLLARRKREHGSMGRGGRRK